MPQPTPSIQAPPTRIWSAPDLAREFERNPVIVYRVIESLGLKPRYRSGTTLSFYDREQFALIRKHLPSRATAR